MMRLVHNSPIASLLTLFTAWKVLLLTLAIISPGPGYDTSTQLLFRGYGVNSALLSSTSAGDVLAQKLTRWDAIYFATSAERGYQLEQEWAFGWGLTRAIAYLAKRKSSFASTKHYITLALNSLYFLQTEA
jgi:GPI mannosyltransferase 2